MLIDQILKGYTAVFSVMKFWVAEFDSLDVSGRDKPVTGNKDCWQS